MGAAFEISSTKHAPLGAESLFFGSARVTLNYMRKSKVSLRLKGFRRRGEGEREGDERKKSDDLTFYGSRIWEDASRLEVSSSELRAIKAI
jgi:hypothetical protein